TAVLELLRANALVTEGIPDDLAHFVVAREGDAVVGVAGLEPYEDTALLRSVAVAASHRGTGLGRRLVDRVLDDAAALGMAEVVLLTETARDWFPRFGFSPTTRAQVPAAVKNSVEFAEACPESATVMSARPGPPVMRALPLHVLVVCTGNSARSQVAEALLATLGGERIAAASAGARPAERVNPGALEVLARHGIEWAGREPQSIDAVADRRWDVVITVCDHAKEACPVLPGQPVMVHWGLPDPAHVPGEAERRAAFEATFVTLERRIRALLDLPLETMTDAERQRSLRALAAD
ncbi:MAG TPA: arsenic resistance N-acetyltransferase ArsN2, partial [Gemmatimonadales bacterium]|nr:arsenic resistance N-acetyltransferase ArsN2 [Gemmatimonadales bacterium]